MPIECQDEIRAIGETEFHQIEHTVVGVAFEVHNALGRLLEEDNYQGAIAARCRRLGLDARREMWIRVTHADFLKEYRVDLMVERGVVVETKTVAKLNPAHHAQVLNYLLLTETHHGSLINLRPTSVEKRFVSTTLTYEDRSRIRTKERDWQPLTPEFTRVRECILALFQDWGAYLEKALYLEALTHFLGGKGNVIRRIPIFDLGEEVGRQEVHLLAPDIALALTAIRGETNLMELHQRRFLSHTNLQAIAWINLNGPEIQFTTLQK